MPVDKPYRARFEAQTVARIHVVTPRQEIKSARLTFPDGFCDGKKKKKKTKTKRNLTFYLTEDCKTGFLQETFSKILLSWSGVRVRSTPPDRVKLRPLHSPIMLEHHDQDYRSLRRFRCSRCLDIFFD